MTAEDLADLLEADLEDEIVPQSTADLHWIDRRFRLRHVYDADYTRRYPENTIVVVAAVEIPDDIAQEHADSVASWDFIVYPECTADDPDLFAVWFEELAPL